MQNKTRRTYQKPMLSKVKLAPQEAVIAGCKQTSGTRGKGVGMRCTGKCNKAAGT